MHPRIAELLQYLDIQREALRATVERVPHGQRERSPEPERWSVAEILEHLLMVEATITLLFTSGLAEARERGLGPETETTPVLATLDLTPVVDRSHRRVAMSKRVQPQGMLDAMAAWTALEATREAFREAILSGDGLALGAFVHPRPHPIFGSWNLYQWVAFVGAHEARHTAQILEIADAVAKRSAAAGARRGGTESSGLGQSQDPDLWEQGEVPIQR